MNDDATSLPDDPTRIADHLSEITVSVGEGSSIFIGSGLSAHCGEMIRKAVGTGKAALVTDTTVEALYAGEVRKRLEQAGFEVCTFSFVPGEASKTLQTLSALLEFIAGNHLTRTDCIVALGGGVVGDLAGFAAGCYLRGIRYVQMPTTLLAAVDSSVGGKTAVDLPQGKNLAGLFWQPVSVICDIDFLNSLPQSILLDGIAEALKTAILGDEALFLQFEERAYQKNLLEVVSRCVRYKAQVVEADERERGNRKLLNLGHTVGHAIESCSAYGVSHGSAVSVGLAVITRAATRRGVCAVNDACRILRLLDSLGLPTATEFSTTELMHAILHDKKRQGNTITLVLPERIGSCVLYETDLDELPDILELGREGIE